MERELDADSLKPLMAAYMKMLIDVLDANEYDPEQMAVITSLVQNDKAALDHIAFHLGQKNSYTQHVKAETIAIKQRANEVIVKATQ